MWSLGGLALTLIYPFCKRFIAAPQIVLGLAFSWSIPMAYVACEAAFDMTLYLHWAGVAIWIVVYDTFYAMVDIDDDIEGMSGFYHATRCYLFLGFVSCFFALYQTTKSNLSKRKVGLL